MLTYDQEYFDNVEKDAYAFRQWKDGRLNYVIDIGAAQGWFALFARLRQPDAIIYALEPRKKEYDQLEKNIGSLPGVFLDRLTLGNGNEVEVIQNRIPELIKTLQFTQLINKYNIDLDNNIFIKINCFGLEKFLMGDKEAEELLKKSNAVSLKAYFPSSFRFSEEKASQPPWGAYEHWIRYVFGQTHNITYANSRKEGGFGIYQMVKK
jgi:hypothetical protein|tara:strand:+ start:3405 stop:4028 length:624 start_codon:yes stop_codon:yes gene_type:complete